MFNERDYEKAAELAQGEIDAAISRHREQQDRRGPGSELCQACGDPIPEKRRIAVAAIRCAPCQRDYEARQ